MSGKQQKDYPGSRDTLLSSDAWCADLARGTLCGKKREAVSTHGQEHTKIQGDTNATVSEGCFANMSHLGQCECSGRWDSQATAPPKIPKSQQSLGRRLFGEVAVMKEHHSTMRQGLSSAVSSLTCGPRMPCSPAGPAWPGEPLVPWKYKTGQSVQVSMGGHGQHHGKGKGTSECPQLHKEQGRTDFQLGGFFLVCFFFSRYGDSRQ